MFSETIDVSPGHRVNVSDLALVDDATGESKILFYLVKSRLSTVVDALRLNITLDPFERVGAVANSSFLDGSPLKLQANAVAHDVAFNYNINPTLINITEIPDLSPIVTVNASIDYNDGTLTMFFTEPVDITPLSLINTSRVFLVNKTGDKQISNYRSTKVPGIDHFNLTLKLHEDDRVHLITLSGTQGGDNTPILMDVYSGAVQDIATNVNLDNFGVFVEEIADTTRPLFVSGEIDYNDGMLRINASETIDTTPRHFVNLSKFFLTRKHPTGKSEGDHVDGGNVQLLASTVISNDTVTLLSIRLSEPERVAAISYSGTPGVTTFRIPQN